MKICSICALNLTNREAFPFRISGVTGYLCKAHDASLGHAVGQWTARATAQAKLDREAQEAEERAQLEREATSLVAQTIANDRMAKLALEALPLATRRALRIGTNPRLKGAA